MIDFKTFQIRILFLIIVLPSIGFGQYCVPIVAGPGGGISNVTLNTLNNTTPLSQGYVDYSATTTIPNLIVSNTEQIQITTSSFQFFEVWIDWNQDFVFGAGENVPFAAAAGTFTLNINVPAGALLGNTRMRVQSRTSFGGGGPCTTTQGNGDIEDYTVNIIALPMQVDSISTSLVTYGCFPNDVVDKMLLRVDVEISYSLNPITLTDLSFNTALSTNANIDIANARLYQTNNAVFSKNNPFGTIVLNPNGNYSFSGTYALTPGTNYFWITYDITNGATPGNLIEAEFVQATISSSLYTPTISSPKFSQIIDNRSNYRRKEANIWYPDRNVGIDFNCTNPVVINNQHAQFSISQTEGTGSICRVNGDLLFYADGNKVYNRVHEIMPNGAGINSNSSKTMGLLIPKPGSSTNFYLISPSGQSLSQDTLLYSEIDLTLDSGFGDIVPNQKNIPIMPDPFNEAVAIIEHCNGIDFWLCVPRNNTNEIHSFLISSSGINTTPIISTGVSFPSYTNIARGTVKFSPNGKWLVVTNQLSTGVVGDPYLFSFDNSTGVASAPIALNTNDRHSASFSPDNSRLYMNQGNALYQYDLCSPNITNSRTFIGNVPGNLWLIQNAPDGKIYMDPGGNATAYSVINNPNGLGAACNFSPNGFSLAPYSHQSTLKFVSSYNESIFNESILDSTVIGYTMSTDSICQYGAVSFNDTSLVTPGCASNALLTRDYYWDFGDPTSGVLNYSTNQNENHTYNTPGTYTIKFAVTEGCQSDTIVKTLAVLPVDSIFNPVTICASDSVLIGSNYENSNGVYVQNLTTINGCDSIITTNLTVLPLSFNTVNTSICQGDSILLQGAYQNSLGTYVDTLFGASSVGCDSIVTTNLIVNPIPIGTSTASVCQGDSVLIGNIYYSTAGTYNDTIFGGAFTGCDSIVQVTLTILPVATGTDTQTACVNYTWIDGITYTSNSTTATDTIFGGATNGCDSIVTLDLTILQPALSTDTQTACENFVWIDGNIYTSNNNTATDTIFGGAINGCDSIITLNLTIFNTTSSTTNINICQGDSILINGNFESISGTYADTLFGANSNGCDSIVNTILTVTPMANASINPVSNLCLNDTPTTLTAANSGGTWSGNGITDATNGIFSPSTNGVGTQQIIYTISGTCGDADTIDVTVNANPSITYVITDDNCGAAEGLIEVTVNTGINPITFNWDTGENTQNITNLTEGIYTVIVTDSSGCSITEPITLNDQNNDCEFHIYLPNAFTPNGDGENDVLFLRGKGIESFTLVIYNRWGNKVFETNSLTYGWDGTFKGNVLNPAVFVYVVDVTFVNGETTTEKGNISIIK